MRNATRLTILLAAATMLAVALPAGPALGQTVGRATATITIDSPTEGAELTNGTQVVVGGWAVDTGGPGTGIDAVRIYLDNRMDAGGRLVGEATYGKSRPDVGTSLGNSAYANSGFDELWTPRGLSAGQHTLYVYARSRSGAWSYNTVGVTVRAQSAGQSGPRYDDPYAYPGMYPPGPYPPPGIYPPGGWYPRYPYSPGYPYYPPRPPSDGVCIMIYPPPPGC